MRIISGKYKNRKINFTKLKVRPTTNFAKESLFNLLNNRINLENIKVLDLFSGSGNIILEFISRGSTLNVAIDSNPKCVHFIKKVQEELKINNLEVYCSTATKYIYQCNYKFDVIFIDPPYNFKQFEYENIIETINKKKLINNGGSVVIEHSKFINFNNYNNFVEQRNYGKVNFSFLYYD